MKGSGQLRAACGILTSTSRERKGGRWRGRRIRRLVEEEGENGGERGEDSEKE